MPTDLPVSSPVDERDTADRDLLQRVSEHRDIAAMEELYVRFKPRLMSFLRRLSRDEGLIEEACNDVMVKVWEKAHQYQARSKVSSWVFSIAYRTCLRMVKKQSRQDLTIHLMGDDLPDLPMLIRAGFSFCPTDAVPEVIATCDHICGRIGGDGAVREAAEILLKAKGRWTGLVEELSSPVRGQR